MRTVEKVFESDTKLGAQSKADEHIEELKANNRGIHGITHIPQFIGYRDPDKREHWICKCEWIPNK